MQARNHPVVLASDGAEFSEDLKRLVQDLAHHAPPDAVLGECTPPLDVYETDHTLELVMDLPGVDRTWLRLAVKGDAVLIVGFKPPRRSRGDSSFHLVERGYGRFARTVRLAKAGNGALARATLAGGELRVSIPKVSERRGRLIPIALSSEFAPE